MADTSIFEIDNHDIDLKNYQKINLKACLNDTVILKFDVFNNSTPVDLTDFYVEFRAYLPKSTVPYSQVDNVVKSGNTLTITCDKELCAEIGQIQATLRIWNSQMLQKSNYLIILKVMSTIPSDEVIQSEATLSALNSLDWAINRYLELKVDLMGQITLAETVLTNLTNEVISANTVLNNMVAENTVLNTSYANAVDMNNKLDNNVNRASNLDAQVEQHIQDLNSNIAVAKYYDNELIATTKNSEQLNTDLTAQNQLASEQITIMKQFGDIKVLVQMMSNYKIELDSLSHLLDIVMQSNPIHWTDDNGNDVLDDSGNIITI
jgi:hypothetical protein